VLVRISDLCASGVTKENGSFTVDMTTDPPTVG
jgi:hypothetical protein